jgi:hypothetical protein
VDLLIQKGADVNFVTNRRISTLQESLYIWEQMKLDIFYDDLVQLYNRESLFQGCYKASKIINVVRSLLDTGACAKHSAFFHLDHPNCDNEDHIDEACFYCSTFSSLDLAVLSGISELVEMLLCVGAEITKHSFEAALHFDSFEGFDRLQNSEAPVPKEIVQAVMRRSYTVGWQQSLKMLLARQQDLEMRRLATIQTIRFGDLSVVDDLISSGNPGPGSLFHGGPNLAVAIENCCRSSHIGVLHRILDQGFTYRSAIIPWLGSSIQDTVSSHHDNVTDIIDVLLSAGVDVNAILWSNQTALLTAVKKQNKMLIGKLIRAGAALNIDIEYCQSRPGYHKSSGSVLVEAIGWGDNTVIKDLIEAGADTNASGGTKGTTYYQSECQCKTPLTAAIIQKNWKCVKYLLSQGAAVNNLPGISLGIAPLAAAISSRNGKLVRFLIESGANPWHPQALEAAMDDIGFLDLLLARLDSH